MTDEHDVSSGVVQTLTTTTGGHLVERHNEIDSMTAILLAEIYENPNHATAEGLARLAARNRALTAVGDNDEIMQAVAGQSAVIEGLFHRYCLMAQDANAAPAAVEAYIRIALAAERVFLKCVAVLATLKTLRPSP